MPNENEGTTPATEQEMQESQVQPVEPQPAKDDGRADEKDWKAIARMWEDRAKANKAKADKLDEIEEAGKTELQKAQERAEKAERELADANARAQRDALVARVAEENGVPASLLVGDDEESLEASAKRLVEWGETRQASFPVDTGGAAGVPPVTVDV